MDKQEQDKDFVSYEDARVEKTKEEASDEITSQEIAKANQILNPDENSMNSRG